MTAKKLPVAIHIFPSLDSLELVHFDDKTGEVDKATSLPCLFDPVTRQLQDRDMMLQCIRDLYLTTRIPFNTPSVLIVPSFFTREIDLPTDFSKDELRSALTSEAERFYVFKKAEPQIDWVSLPDKRFLYTAYPKTEIERYMGIFNELKIPLLSIELNYFGILRGLMVTGTVREEVEQNLPWGLLVISDTCFFGALQEGAHIVRTIESPLSLSTEDEQGTLQEIQQDFQHLSDGAPDFSQLVVINNTTRLSSDALLQQLQYGKPCILIEQNVFTLKSKNDGDFSEQTASFPCSLEGLGGVFHQHFPEISGLNLMMETGEDLASILHYRQMVLKWLCFGLAGSVLLVLFVWGVCALVLWQKDMQAHQLTTEIDQLTHYLSPQKLAELKRKRFIKAVIHQNVMINNLLVSVGKGTPKAVWIKKIQIDSHKLNDNALIQIEGEALNLDQINSLLSVAKKEFPKGNLEISNAAQATTPDGQVYFTWSLQNKGTLKSGDADSKKGPGG